MTDTKFGHDSQSLFLEKPKITPDDHHSSHHDLWDHHKFISDLVDKYLLSSTANPFFFQRISVN